MMNILILAPQPFFQDRGTPIAVKMLAEDLQNDGHDIDLLVFHEGEDVPMGNVQLLRIVHPPFINNIPPGFSLKKIICDIFMMAKAVRLCSSKKYDVVHAVEESVYIAYLLKKIFGLPYIYDIDSWMSDQLIDKYAFLKVLRPIFNFFEKMAVRGSSGAVAVCLSLEEKVYEIHNTLPLLRLEDVSLIEDCDFETENLRNITGNEGEILLYVGNLESYQGIDLLLEAFSLLCKKQNTVNLVIIGGRDEHIEKYKDVSQGLQIDKRVFFTGPRPVDMLGGFLKQADILVSPRMDGENTPMKIYSYMGSGTPIVATSIKSHTQVLNKDNSFLSAPEPESMCASLLEVLDDKENGQRKAEIANSLTEKNYSRSAFRSKITNFYKELSNVWNLRF